ncbi:MAG: fumarylacetoacetate hydrolase family protein [Anaerolineae bacterium]|nr:fumarylacetoacetate hydrolase family protein [Anaerolineae bacterium]
MKYATAEIDGARVVGVIEAGRLAPLEFDGDMRAYIAAGAPQVAAGAARPLAQVRLCAPVDNPSKMLAIGRNYAEHAAEEGVPLPEAPLIFAKLPSAIIGHGDTIQWDPEITAEVDFEAELAVIIGREARGVSEAEALSYVFGYTCANDVSARDLQRGDGQWTRAKGLDTFCPLGPWIETDIADPNNLSITSWVNLDRMQDSNTGSMIFKVPYLIAYISRMFTLYPGDIILTGTPSGVGFARKPPRFLGDGDSVRVELEGIGVLQNVCAVVKG